MFNFKIISCFRVILIKITNNIDAKSGAVQLAWKLKNKKIILKKKQKIYFKRIFRIFKR